MKLAVIGIGSRASGDDIVGLELVEALAAVALSPDCSVHVWEDADALTLTHGLLELDQPALIVDCASMSVPPGQHRLVSADAIAGAGLFSAVSTHGAGMGEALALARALGYGHEVHVFGVQPFDVAVGNELSEPMNAALPQLAVELRLAIDTLVGDEIGTDVAGARS